MTIANDLYNSIDVDSSEGVINQVTNFCANHEGDVEKIENGEVIFYDGSAATFDDYSIAVDG